LEKKKKEHVEYSFPRNLERRVWIETAGSGKDLPLPLPLHPGKTTILHEIFECDAWGWGEEWATLQRV
jgi:hypothetical protein